MKRTASGGKVKPAALITKYIDKPGDWRSVTLAQLRSIILGAGPDLDETWKWSVPVWESDGIVCVAGVFKSHVKLTFPKGASLKDPKRLFNAGMDGKIWRSIDFHEGDPIDAAGLRALIRDAAAVNAELKDR